MHYPNTGGKMNNLALTLFCKKKIRAKQFTPLNLAGKLLVLWTFFTTLSGKKGSAIYRLQE
jgi:hypothetical protein